MRKLVLCIVCLAAMMAAGTSLKAQEISITLVPGWNWISYTNAVSMEIDEALGDFTPVQGDIIKSKNNGTTTYNGTMWRGSLTHFMPGQGYKYFSARTETTSFVFAQALSPFVTTAEPTDITTASAVVGGNVTLDEGNHIYARGVCWDTVQMPTVDDNHISNGIEIGSFTDTLIGLTSNTIYFVRVYVVTDFGLAYGEELSFTTLESNSDHDYVDLGLPSGLLWATSNVGANSPEDYGDYFAWGETQPKDVYNWSTYQYCMGSENTLTKYCSDSYYGYNDFFDNLTTLLSEDDAATANWGVDWRMPTREEWQELYNNTSQTWTTQNGINGQLFTASNGNSLFLPAAGQRHASNLSAVGSIGRYWSSSLLQSMPSSAVSIAIDLDYYLTGVSRYYGRSVRAVRSSGLNTAPTGAINGKFTINENGDQVYFSQGNLQYQASTNIWRFAENQWDYIGEDNINISPIYSGWIDLFGWGTSGYEHGANCYQPWSTSTSYSDYYAYGSYTNNLYDQTGQADWGYNPINNGGNIANQWRTLTQSEWYYVFNTRSTTSGIRYAMANVNNVNGVLLLPDDWNESTYSLNETNNSGTYYSSNTITASQWTTIENAGAVFLPTSGLRTGILVDSGGSNGYYWSASYIGRNEACNVYFRDSYLDFTYHNNRRNGESVRLVAAAVD